MNKFAIAATIAAVVLTLVRTATAETVFFSEIEEGAETHDGFFFRVATGFGLAPSSGVERPADMRVDSPSTVSNVAVGWSLTEHVVLHVDFTNTGLDGNAKSASDATDYDTLLLDSVGVGATYYFLPSNAYLSGSFGATNGRFEHGGGHENVLGYGFNGLVGQELWASANWGVGLAASFTYAHIPFGEADVATDIDDDAYTYGLVVSATYN